MSLERPTFSPLWHRVRALRPRLRPHVQITRQHYRGRRWHVVHDPASNQFYRLTPVAYELVCMLDGVRDVDAAWNGVLGKHGDRAPTQPEVVELLGQLYNANLLAVDTTPDVEQFLHRGRQRVQRRLAQQAIGLMYFKLRLFNPDRLLTAVKPLLRPVLNRWGLAAWAVLMLAALAAVLPSWPRLVGQFDLYVSPANAGWMIVVFVLLKLWHELGHGVICKRFGGQVPEAGAMLLVLLPSPFVDASSAWAFDSKWRRTAVGAGGMIFELFAAAVAAFVWLLTPDASLAKQLAYYAMLSASVATVVFNINPLMRFDGYYMLADLLEVPNLMGRSQQHINYLFQRHVFRSENARPVSALAGERAILLTYGLLAMAYRLFLFLTITLWVLGQWFIVGVFLACWSAAMWFCLPVGKFVNWLATSPSIAERRGRVIATSLGLIALGVGLVGLVPVPDWRRGRGVVESAERSGVYFASEGFVRKVEVRSGVRVRKGDVLAVLESPSLERELAQFESQRRELDVLMQQARDQNEAGTAALAAAQIEFVERQLGEVRARLEGLIVRSPQDGVIVGADPSLAAGAYVKRGEGLCEVLEPGSLRVAATLSQGEGGWFKDLPREAYSVEMRTASHPWRVIPGGRVWSPSAAQAELPHPALGFVGGGEVATDQDDKAGRRAKQARFTVYVEAAGEAGWGGEAEGRPGSTGSVLGQPGERVWLRFTLPAQPIAWQVIDRIHKTIQGRVNL